MKVADIVTIHATVSYPESGTPHFVAWSGAVPWPSLPRPRDVWICCSDAVYKARFESVSFRGPNATAQAVLLKSSVPSAQAGHLIEVHGFAPAEDLE